MNLNIRELLDGRPSRLRYVFRYSTTRVQHPESVAEHSYFVVLYAMMIGRYIQLRDTRRQETTPIQMGVLLQKAAVHDLEEAVTGDFPREFKHSSDELKKMLTKAASIGFRQLAVAILDDDDPDYNMGAEKLIKLWETSKDDSLEGSIIEFVDFLSVLSYVMQEGATANNKIITRHIDSMEKYFAVFESSKYNFIRELVDQAGEMLEELV
jgi:5'-deoxynucleotidase YfbR-like HD superfamily hydrolase